MNKIASLRVVTAETVKNLKIFSCYPAELAGLAVFPLLWVVPLIFQGMAMAGGTKSSYFGAISGTELYLPFVLVGAIVSTYVFSSLYGTGASFRDESYYGTLEMLLASPADRFAILLGKAMSDTIISTIMVIGQGGLCLLLFHVSLNLSQLLMVLAVIALLVIGLYGLGIALAGLTLLVKETRGLTHTVNHLMFLLSPVRYPVEISLFIYSLSLFLPLTHALVMLRGIVLMGKSMWAMWPELIMLSLLDVTLVIMGLRIFHYVEDKTKRSGIIGHY